MNDTAQRPGRSDETDGSPSSNTIVVIGVLGSLVMMLLFAIIVAVGFEAGGDDDANDSRSATAGLPDLAQELGAELWVVDDGDSSPRTRDDNRVSLQFHDGRLSGLGPCNAYQARFDLDEDDESLRVSALRQTSRECSPRTMRAEREYFAALRAVRDLDLDDRDHLVLTNSVGDRLAFDAHGLYDEVDGTWRVRQVGNQLDPPVEGTEPTVAFDVDEGDLVIRTGCNTLRASWALIGDRLDTDAAAQTLKLCVEPEGLEAQEAVLARIVEPGVRVHVAPGRLITVDRFRRILAVATQPSG